MAVVFQNWLTGMLVSIIVLATLVGFAFLGFDYPAYRGWSYLNPFFNGVALIGSLDHYGFAHVARPILVLVAFNLAAVALGRQRTIAIIERS